MSLSAGYNAVTRDAFPLQIRRVLWRMTLDSSLYEIMKTTILQRLGFVSKLNIPSMDQLPRVNRIKSHALAVTRPMFQSELEDSESPELLSSYIKRTLYSH